MRKLVVMIVFVGLLVVANTVLAGVTFPPSCDTDAKKLDYLAELDEKLRLWHKRLLVKHRQP